MDPIPSPWTFMLFPISYCVNSCSDGYPCKDIFENLSKNFSDQLKGSALLGKGCICGTLLGPAHCSSRKDCPFMLLSQRFAVALCFLTFSPGLVVTRLTTCQCDDDQCCLHNVPICVYPHLHGQAFLTWIGHMHGLLLELHVFALFLVRTLVFESFWNTGILNLSPTLGYVEWFPSLWFVFRGAFLFCCCLFVCMCCVCTCACMWEHHWKS